jgi:D-aspartate ligase
MTSPAGSSYRPAPRAGRRLRVRGMRTSRAARPATIVVGLDCATGLQSARVLARYGVPIIGLASDLAHPCCRTNVCERVLAADLMGAGLIDVLATLGKDLTEPAVLLPCTDLSVLLISQWRDQLAPWFHVALPEHEVVELLVDKGRFYEYAQQTGLPLPATFVLRSRADAEHAAQSLRFPCVVKPTVKTAKWRAHSAAKAYRVSRREDFLSVYGQCAEWSTPLLAQEWIDGPNGNNFTCNCYFDSASQPLVTFTSRKIRQWPPEVGEGCFSEECRNDIVEQTTIRLFQGAGHRGLGYLEMKRDTRTGQLLIVEPNVGRPTGRSAAAEGAGVALLYTMYCDVLGLPLPRNREQPYRGGKWVHIRRDVQAALYHWRRGELGPREWLHSLRGVNSNALFSWRDPLPFALDACRIIGQLAAPGRRNTARRSERLDLSATPQLGGADPFGSPTRQLEP